MAAFIYKQCICLRTVFCLAFLTVFWALPAAAQTVENAEYTVEGVQVDVSAKNAVMAREKALAEAQVKAFEKLAERLLPSDRFATFTPPDADTVSLLVQDFEVTNEQLSATRYKGTFTVRFRPSAVQAQWAQGNMPQQPAASTPAGQTAGIPKPYLVLPFYQTVYGSQLWGEANPWMRAWRHMRTDRSMMQPTVVPVGDAYDMSKVLDTQPLTYDPVRVQELAARYSADDVMVLLAAKEGRRLNINIYRHAFEGPRFVQKIVVDQLPSETDEALFMRAAMQVKAVLRQQWENAQRNATLAPPQQGRPQQPHYRQQQTIRQQTPPVPYTQRARGPATTYNTHAKFASVQDWVRIKNALDRVPGMQGVVVKTLKSREALLDLRFEGNINQLQAALQKAGILMRATSMNAPVEIYMGATPLSQYR